MQTLIAQSFTNMPEECRMHSSVTLGSNAISSQSCTYGTYTRDGTGAYTLTLNDVWDGGMSDCELTVIRSTATFGKPTVLIDSSAVAATKTITFKVLDAAGNAVDLASGTVLNFCWTLKRSTLANA